MHAHHLLIAEPAFRSSHWVADVAAGMLAQARRTGDRLTAWTADLDTLPFEEPDCYFVLFGLSRGWTAQTLAFLHARSAKRILLISQNIEDVPGDVHWIRIDRRRSILALMASLQRAGRTRIALLGIDPHSQSDQERVQVFREAIVDFGLSPADTGIFYNPGLLRDCVGEALDHTPAFDTYLCANDITAISLLSALHARGIRVPEDAWVAGFGDMALCAALSPTLTTISLDFEESGRQAVMLASYLQRVNPPASLHVHMPSRIMLRQSTGALTLFEPEEVKPPKAPRRPIDFSQDPDVFEITCLNRMLIACDGIDRSILRGILLQKTSQQMADEHFLSLAALKKRVRKLLNMSGTDSKRALYERLCKYSFTLGDGK